jgi:hypothetical protein
MTSVFTISMITRIKQEELQMFIRWLILICGDNSLPRFSSLKKQPGIIYSSDPQYLIVPVLKLHRKKIKMRT